MNPSANDNISSAHPANANSTSTPPETLNSVSIPQANANSVATPTTNASSTSTGSENANAALTPPASSVPMPQENANSASKPFVNANSSSTPTENANSISASSPNANSVTNANAALTLQGNVVCAVTKRVDTNLGSSPENAGSTPSEIKSVATPSIALCDKPSTPSTASAATSTLAFFMPDNTPPSYDMRLEEVVVSQAEKALAVFYVAPLTSEGQKNHRSSMEIAKDGFASNVRKRPEESHWLQEVLSEAKPIINHYSEGWTPLLVPTIMKTIATVPTDPKLPTIQVEKLMQPTVSSTLEISNIPFSQVSPKIVEASRSVDSTSSAISSRSSFATSSGSVMEKCPTHTNAKPDNILPSRSVVSIKVEKVGRSATTDESDQYFYSLIKAMHHIECINQNSNLPVCPCCGFMK